MTTPRKITPRALANTMHEPVRRILRRLRALGVEVRGEDDVLTASSVELLLANRRPARRRPRRRRLCAHRVQLPSAGELLWRLRQVAARTTPVPSDEVFIVHGHDHVRHAVAGFLLSLGLCPVMLEEHANRGQTIIEKLEQHAFAAFAVILLTPDDEGRTRGADALHPRARQNVILELGYFLARLGRHRVCALYVSGVELPSDMLGVLYIRLDEAGGWKHLLEREITAAGVGEGGGR